MGKIFFVSVIFAFSAPIFSQIYLGASVDPGVFSRGKSSPPVKKRPNSFESNLAVCLSTSAMYEIFDSTTPENEILKYSRQGIYRTQLVYLLLLAYEKKEKFEKLAVRIRNGETLAKLSSDYGFNLMENFSRAIAMKEELEKISDDDLARLHDILINKQSPAREPE